jgi:hypothetical protein
MILSMSDMPGCHFGQPYLTLFFKPFTFGRFSAGALRALLFIGV